MVLFLAALASLETSLARSSTDKALAFLITGTISPASVSTAKPKLITPGKSRVDLASLYLALNNGNSFKATETAFKIKGKKVILTSSDLRSESLIDDLKSHNLVIFTLW
ncbi:Uncharacterised protein, partial [Mycoplasmopsis synoviae]